MRDSLVARALCVLVLGAIAVFLVGCGGYSSHYPTPIQTTCPSVTLMRSAGPSSGVAEFPPAAVEPPPMPGTTSAGSVCIATPSGGADVTSPVHIKAVADLAHPIYFIRVYVDGKAVFFDWYNTIDDYLWMSTGSHDIEVLAFDTSGNAVSAVSSIYVGTGHSAAISDIQSLPRWDGCSSVFPAGHPRAGQVCAAGMGTADSTMTQDVNSPSLSGHAAKFTMGGPTGYSNMLWTKYLGGGSAPTHFTYDLSFYIDEPNHAQALEFDVNQTFHGTRWVFGTECNLKDGGVWDVWDGVAGWQPTTVPCASLPQNQWVHLVWSFERVGNQVHYVSVQVNDTTYPLDLYYANQPSWVFEGIDVAFQMDGDSLQEPYNVWLDNVSLQAF